MNKKLFFPALAALLMLAGCTADELDEANGLVPLSLSANIQAEEVTRAGTSLLNSFSNETLGISLTNCISSSGAALTSTTYTVGTGFDSQPYISAGQTATVKGYYPSSAASASSFTVSDNQTTDAKYKESDLMFAAAQNATKSSSSPTLTFVHKMAKLIVNVTAVSGVGSITSVTLNNISRTVGWTASTGALGALSNSGNITMSNNGAVLIPPQTTLEANNFLTIVTSAGTATYKLGKTFDGGSVYTLNINVGLANIGVSTTITGWTGNESTVTVNPTPEIADKAPAGATAVDLGLSVKWANMNVGANSETDYGDFFMWGETTGHSSAISSGTTAADGYSFNWANYKWTNDNGSSFTKYTGSYYSTLLPEDDAAYMNWGGNWRMPSRAECVELAKTFNTNDFGASNTTKWKWEWQTDYNSSGHAGWLISYRKDTSGNTVTSTLFLPAAGNRYNTVVPNQGAYLRYLSSSLYAGGPNKAWNTFFHSSDANVVNGERFIGYSVRAVQ